MEVCTKVRMMYTIDTNRQSKRRKRNKKTSSSSLLRAKSITKSYHGQ